MKNITFISKELKLMKTAFNIILTLLIIMALSNAGYTQQKEDRISEAKDKAILWLKNQKVPNPVVPDPQPERRNLLLSYEIPRSSPVYQYLFGRSDIYDDALAVIAFTMNKDYRNASLVLQALKRLQRKDGGFWFDYNAHNDWPSELDHSEATDRTGATSWVGYASVFFLRQKVKLSSNALVTDTEAERILQMARSIADCILALQVKKKDDPRYGLVTGGKNSVLLKYKNNAVEEVFEEGNIDWASTEHNIDTYYFLRDLGVLSKENKYIKAAKDIKTGLLRIWSVKDKQYYRGIRPAYVDTALALDCASWGAIFSISAGRADYAHESMNIAGNLYAGFYINPKNIRINGYKPYAVKEIYEDSDKQVAPFYFPKDLSGTWKDLNGVWVEGSLGVALAYLKLGDRAKAKSILEQMILLQNERGGFIYFTKEIPHEFASYPGVASTAWFVIVASAYEDSGMLKEFWGE